MRRFPITAVRACAACVDEGSGGVRVCHMQQDHSRGIMAEVQVYATVAQAHLSAATL